MHASGPSVRELPYSPDSAALAQALLGRDWPIFLDSGRPRCGQGRWDILTADPAKTLVTRGEVTEIRSPAAVAHSRADPFTLVAEALGPKRRGVPGLPFAGGAVGYFAYDLARRWVPLPSLARDAEGLPEMAVGIYDWALLVDHRDKRTRLVGCNPDVLDVYAPIFLAALSGRHAPGRRESFRVLERVRSNLTRSDYFGALGRIRRYLLDGDCYQVNFAQRFAAPAQGDPWDLYRRLRAVNAAPFGAYLATPDWAILSSSPERFLRLRGRLAETKPIKGTCPRGADPEEDRRLAESLRLSPKDRAENLMIVDLLRNDLGKVCAFGSVGVPALFEVESFARVHHLVSTVQGRLAKGSGALDLLRACFPGGSVTGAPKRRAMEIVEELEPHRRGVYCGAIGYLGFDGSMDTNIAIRTLVCSGGVARLWAGGGIVADSDPESEYLETLHKAAPLLELLGGLRRGS